MKQTGWTNSEGLILDSSSPTRARISIHGEGESVNVDDEMAVGDDVERNYWKGVANMEVEQARVEVDEAPVIQINLNMLEDVEKLVDSPTIGSNSQSRTNTACFCQNGYSDEILKITNHLSTVKGIEGNEGPLINVVEFTRCMGSSNECPAFEAPHTKDLNASALEVDLSLIHI